jgi:predicted HicB family RNase H-like nuclease
MAKGDAKARIVPVRFNPDLMKRVTAASKASKQTVSEWIRSTLNAATTG